MGIFWVSLFGCNTPAPFPRPFGFHRIDLPDDKSYKIFQNEICPFTFEYPSLGQISKQTLDSCWVDIYYPAYDCKWHITYRSIPIQGRDRAYHLEEHRSLIYKHAKMATRINNTPVQEENGYGVLYEVYGNVGTPAQFFFSDSTGNHVVMTSFYFNTALKNDSLQPIINYMKGELKHMMSSIQWNR